MDKTSQKVTKDKDPKRIDAGRKGRKNFMNKMKENILNDAKKGSEDTTNSSNETTSPTNNSSNETTNATNNASNETTRVSNTATTRSNDTCVYGVGILAVLAIGVSVFFVYNLLTLKIKNSSMKNRINNQNVVICFRSYIINNK